MKHTQGPWIVEGTAVFTLHGAYYIAETEIKGKSFTKSGDVATANAHLIASAPEMLEDLEYIQKQIQSTPEILDSALLGLILIKIQNTISKARGES